MIGFLSPLYLLAGLAVAVPLLIHLMRRRIGTRIEFPAVRYLLRAEQEHSRKLRLRNLLLMLLRVAAVLAVTMAAARPVLRVSGSGHAPTALAIVLDNSLSTTAIVGGRTVLDDLRQQARAIARRASDQDRLWLITADGTVRGGSRGAILDAIDRAEPLGGAGDPPRALARGAALVRQAGLPERELALLTDGQESAWPAPVALDEVRARVYLPAGAPPANRAVVEATPVPPRWTPRGAVRARLLAPDSATYRVTLGGRTLARGTAARDEEITLRVSPAERGWVAGTVETEPDELRGDDMRHFAAWIGPAPTVAVRPSAGPFARSAVDALVQAERVAVGGDVTLASADDVQRLPALLLAPGDPVRLGAANRQLERLDIPWRFGAPRRGESTARAQQGPALEGVTVALRYPLVARAGAVADTLATAGGDPWIVSGPGYAIVGSPLDPAATTLPVRAAFVPWLGEMLTTRLAAARGGMVDAVPGERVALPEGVDGLEPATGSRIAVAGDSITAPGRAGVYFLLRGGERAGALVVNAEPDESRLARAGADAMRARLRGRDVRVTADSAAYAPALFASAPRRAVLAPLVILAVALLLGESLVAGAGRRRGG
ncbi:MAG TPA: BatA and WFA domain-containing protein [Gemmatimonadaceae bacterium]|nr:BatA and WFA domain-containing protein [Gemmatimonadaceae bacterium]